MVQGPLGGVVPRPIPVVPLKARIVIPPVLVFGDATSARGEVHVSDCSVYCVIKDVGVVNLSQVRPRATGNLRRATGTIRSRSTRRSPPS